MAKWRLGAVLVATVTTMVSLAALGQLLRLRSGYGVEDFLGWPTDHTTEMVRLWRDDRHLGTIAPWVSGAYLGFDTAVFIPLYGLSFIGLWRLLQKDFAAHSNHPPEWCQGLVRIGAALVLLLSAVDLVENFHGLSAMNLAWVGAVGLLGAAATLMLLFRVCDHAWLFDVLRSAGLSGKPHVAFIHGAVFLASLIGAIRIGGPSAHALKGHLVLPLVLGPVMLALWVQYGPHADRARWPRVVAVRSSLGGLLWRTRYVLMALAACSALMLVMDQGRDVIYAMASHPWPNGGGNFVPGALVATCITMVLTGLALWVLGYSCWLWSRLVLRVAPRYQIGIPQRARTEDDLAKFWARLLGITPAMLVLGMVLAVLPNAIALDKNKGPVVILLGFAITVAGGSIGFIWRRDRAPLPPQSPCYYSSARLSAVLEQARGARLFGFVPTVCLPGSALLLALACRTLQQAVPTFPTLTLPIMLFLVAFWLGIVGWISLFEESERVPWFVIGLTVTGVLGFFGLTENHRVPLSLTGAMASPWYALAHSWALGALLAITSVYVARELLKEHMSSWSLGACALLLVAGGWSIMQHADSALPEIKEANIGDAPTAPAAMAAWLDQLCDGDCPAGEPQPVYIIAAEGGGIRSAYWAALVLERLERDAHSRNVDFARRTFAMTGVSGGSVGLAAYRACRLEQLALPPEHQTEAALLACITRFGSTDLLAPLVGAWFFEDAVARWLPKRCDHAGCGFMSRGLWFEGAMNIAVPQMGQGLMKSRRSLLAATGTAHQPYLLLNSTWVESGERAIASEFIIDWKWFPGARDQLAILGGDIPLTTASHNSARFPFTNALGAVFAPAGHCEPDAYDLRRTRSHNTEPKACGHLADGGYFDNSAGHTTADLLRLLDRCLHDTNESSESCPGLDKAKRAVLLGVVQPHVILIRNGVALSALPLGACTDPEAVPSIAALGGEPQPRLAVGVRQPKCVSNGRLFIDALGPLWTALNDLGTGANGSLAGARPGLPGAALVGQADLREDGPLYPLGWHLSPAARAAMSAQADALRIRELLDGDVQRRKADLERSVVSDPASTSP